MKTINFYQVKYEALESFYGWADGGSDYNTAAEQCFYYDDESEDVLTNIIRVITVAVRFARCGRDINGAFKERLNNSLKTFETLDLSEYDLSEEERNILAEEAAEASAL